MRMRLPKSAYSKLLLTPPVQYLRNLIAAFLLKHPDLIKKLPAKRHFQRFGKIILFLFLGLAVIMVVFRHPLTKSIMNLKIDAYNKSHHADLKIGSFEFKGLLGIELHNISLKPQDGDTLLTIKNIETHISLARLFMFKLGLSDMTIVNT